MQTRLALRLFFGFILVSLATVNIWACLQQPLWEWGGLTREPDRWWTLATFVDAYYGFLTFYVWVLYKEARWMPRLGWLIAILSLGNLAMATYALVQLNRLAPGEAAWVALTRRNS